MYPIRDKNHYTIQYIICQHFFYSLGISIFHLIKIFILNIMYIIHAYVRDFFLKFNPKNIVLFALSRTFFQSKKNLK